MDPRRNRLYRNMIFLCCLGYLWITLSFLMEDHHTSSVCVIKHVTGYPCPGCGTTRSLTAFFSADISKAMYFNPLGIVFGLVILIFPPWILYDLIQKKQSFMTAYHRLESKLKKPILILFILVLMILNWIWNLQKDI